jgi:hypothetical protein
MRQANPYAGEVGISAGAEDFVFRPSFFAMASLGTPQDLPRLYADSHKITDSGFIAALSALHACADKDVCGLVGCFEDVDGAIEYCPGSVPVDNIQILGSKLLYSGMIGRPSKRQGEASGSFDPAEFVAAAVAHLGMSFDDAWQLTMVEFQAAIKAKFPDSDEENNYPSADEHRALVASMEKN